MDGWILYIPLVSQSFNLLCVQPLDPAISLAAPPLVVLAFEEHVVQDGATQESDCEVSEYYAMAQSVVGCVLRAIHIRRHNSVEISPACIQPY